MAEATNADRGYTITRVFEAPRELVWKTLTEPDHWVQWFGEPGTTWEGLTMDVRPGGDWTGTMVGPERAYEIPWHGKYIEVEEPSRLVIAISDQDSSSSEYESMTITLADRGGATELVLRQSGGHLTDEEYGQAKEGTASFLENLAVLLSKL
jgi:uncharacterized protein YndB with AHSA1/START domain